VVTTNVVPYVKDGENGLVANVGNENNLKEKLERILSDQNLKEKLKIYGLNTAKKYDLNQSKRKFEQAIKDIIFPDDEL
jgi:glycosyltransferase involved in cell wall biosynthesis